MGYLLKEEKAEAIKEKFKNSYIANKLDLSGTYVSLIINRRRVIQKHVAYAFVKTLDESAEVEDYFDEVE